MTEPKLVYGGYVNFPLAPKDVKNVQKMADEYTTADDLSSLLAYICTEKWGIKIEGDEAAKSWKAVVYNRVSLIEGDNHAYYISGESDTLLKALVVIRYKLEALKGENLATWITNKPKEEFR